jgi:peptidoglycan/LPS O-acetylase OafA/YrhL
MRAPHTAISSSWKASCSIRPGKRIPSCSSARKINNKLRDGQPAPSLDWEMPMQPFTPTNALATGTRLQGIEALRAVAALMVVLYHLVMLAGVSAPGHLHIVKTHFGLGVPLFYALSGFVLAYGYLDKLESRRQVLQFYIKRYFRIAPLFYVLIAVWLLFLKAREATLPPFHEIVLNASFLFGLVPGKHESIVAAGWSIGVEMLLYLVFPVIAALISSLRAGILAFVMAVLVSSAFYTAAQSAKLGSYAYMNLITHLPTFLAGIVAFLLWRKLGFIQNRLKGMVLLGLFIIIGAAQVYWPDSKKILALATGVRLDVYIWSFLFALLILSICLWPARLLVNNIGSTLGKISFSLYLWHPLVIIGLSKVYPKIGDLLGSGLLNFLCCAGLTVSLLSILSYASFRVVEQPGMKYGKEIANAC